MTISSTLTPFFAKTCKLLSVVSLVLFSKFGAYAQSASAEFTSVGAAYRADTAITLDAKVDAAAIRLGSQQRLILTPVLVSADGNNELILPAVVLHGSTRHKVYRRQVVLGQSPFSGIEPLAVLKVGSRAGDPYSYHAEVPMQPWMRRAHLVVRREVTGCADCGIEYREDGTGKRLFPAALVPEPVAPDFEPIEVESSKVRTEKHVAHLNYKQARHELLPNFSTNAAELAAIDTVMRELKTNPTLRINGFEIRGYASPEGEFNYNIALSKRRAYTFRNYIARTYGYPERMFTVKWFGEDWEGLQRQVAASTLPNKEKILSIIEDDAAKDGREKQLADLDGGVTYRHLLSTVFPSLRRSEEYIVGLEVKNYSVEEAKQVMRTHPGRLSLAEFSAVADSYPETDPQRVAVWQIAAETYPQAPEARINTGVALYRQGRFAEAAELVAGCADKNPAARRLFTAALIKSGRYGEALVLLKAGTPADEETAGLIRSIEDYIEDNK